MSFRGIFRRMPDETRLGRKTVQGSDYKSEHWTVFLILYYFTFTILPVDIHCREACKAAHPPLCWESARPGD